MDKPKSLAEFLGVIDPRPSEVLSQQRSSFLDDAIEISDPSEFCKRILESREFRQYILDGIVLRDFPPAIICRIIDHGWGKPPERVEHTGKDGRPIETIAEVRRVVVHVGARPELSEGETLDVPYTRH